MLQPELLTSFYGELEKLGYKPRIDMPSMSAVQAANLRAALKKGLKHTAGAGVGAALGAGAAKRSQKAQTQQDRLLRDIGKMTPEVFEKRQKKRRKGLLAGAAAGGALGVAAPAALPVAASKAKEQTRRASDYMWNLSKPHMQEAGEELAKRVADIVEKRTPQMAQETAKKVRKGFLGF